MSGIGWIELKKLRNIKVLDSELIPNQYDSDGVEPDIAKSASDSLGRSDLAALPSIEGLINGLMLQEMADRIESVAILRTCPDFQILYANAYAIKLFSLYANSSVEAMPASVRVALPPALRKELPAKALRSNHEFVMSYAHLGQIISLKVIVAPCFHVHPNAGTAPEVENDGGNTKRVSEALNGYIFHVHNITGQIATEMKLRQAEQLLRNVINASPDLIYYKDSESRWLEANASGIELFKLPQDGFKYKTDAELAELVHPALQDSFRRLNAADHYAWETGKFLQEEEKIVLSNGKSRVYDIFKVPLFRKDGQPEGLVTIGRDITERKNAESKLLERSAILDALIYSDWMLHSSASWRQVATQVLEQLCVNTQHDSAMIMQMKPASAEVKLHLQQVYIWSQPESNTLGEDYQSIVFEDQGCVRWLAMLQAGNPVFGEVADFSGQERRFLRMHGSRAIAIIPILTGSVWWGALLLERKENNANLSTQELGCFLAVSRAFGDAIQREQSGKRLHQAQIAFDSATEGIMILDANTNITAVNQGFTEITGFLEEEVLGHPPLSFQYVKHDLWNGVAKDGRWRGEVSNYRKNGEQYQEWLTLTAVKNEEGHVINYVGVFADITEVKSSQVRLQELVNHDSLTGLPNRRLLNELLEQAIKRAERENHSLALLFIDLDRFKAVNDTLGHQVGDKLLYEVAGRIKRAVRESDVVARQGGDEFLVVMDFIESPEVATIVAQKIIHALQIDFMIDSKEIFIGASVGISVFPKDGKEVDTLVKAADIAMYQVKSQGKNNFCFYSDHLRQNAVERYTIESQLRKALERNQFEVHYQPQVLLKTGEIIGAEALIRWNHPELGLVSPAKFIPMAEETGLIVQIGEWVLRQAASQVMIWKQQYPAFQWISVNVSGVQMMRSNFADTVYGVLLETDCIPDLLELEITETTLMHNSDYVINTLDRIKKLGVRLAIDDFGTGYSSLIHLKRLPLDKLKIDQSFVRDLPEDTDDAAIANAIHAMASSLGFSVIAEGVETEEQAAFLRDMGCEEAQGYLFSKPVNVKLFSNLLESKINTH